ncbi:MAG TPA: HAD-IIIC family phosphatase [Terriglobales bacterium]|nr:HAD-IIIC family phosphatase [Terriglobales bacterium]
MNSSSTELYIISDFNLEAFARQIENDSAQPQVRAKSAPHGQVFPSLLKAETKASQQEFCLVWTQPEGVLPSFRKALQLQPFAEQDLWSEVRHFSDCLKQCCSRFRAVFVTSWALPSFQRGYGLLDFQQRSGLRRLLLEVNLLLAKELESSSGTYLLDSTAWLQAAGSKAWSPKLWYLSKCPFGNEVLQSAIRDVKAAIASVSGSYRKLIVVDLDDTLWGGVVGDLGWQSVAIGGHDYRGEAFADFQRALQTLRRRGVLLAIASKNQEEIALEVLRQHPEMVLRLDDFAAYRINWNDKAANIVDLAAELNVGLQSVVFLDDNPVERARVRQALPEVLVPEWPDDKTLFASELLRLTCFDLPQLTSEDASRTELYIARRQRESAKGTFASFDEWLHSLHTILVVEELNDSNLPRTVQLLNKTNQMNLATRRLGEAELRQWLRAGNRKLWTFRVKDDFGDSGIVGIVSLQIDGAEAQIVDFVLSCRVMGRRIEEAMIAVCLGHARALGVERVRADFAPTAKNRPCLDFWLGSGFAHDQDKNSFSWDLAKLYPAPPAVEILCDDPALLRDRESANRALAHVLPD